MKLKPLQDWVLIQSIEPKEQTAAGIIIPDMAKDKPTEGIVLAIGPGKYTIEKGKEKEKKKEKKFIPTVLKPGQRIIYGKYSAREIPLDGETITLVREEDVLGTVEETRLAEKQPFTIAEKYEKPLAVKKEAKVMTVAAPAARKKQSGEKKAVKKEKSAPASGGKKEKKKAGTVKLTKKSARTTIKKAGEKKTAAKKVIQKPLKKTTEKKAAVKKTSAKKSSPKKTEIPKKKVVQKKTAVKVTKKTDTKKTITAKKKQTAKKPLAKGRPKTKR